ncbi:MAG: ShlB/FhaC/HecB family hemolysin secretion/activation protein [Rhodocyclaceae bacterium]|nr:ShlB/FhaC/HecB family hemolysin secretion/activation protein [Rhodocyclaceae bacterium]
MSRSHLASLLALLLACATQAAAQTLPGPDTPDPSIEHQRQQQRTDQLRRQLEAAEDVRRPAGPSQDLSTLPTGEQPCFPVEQVLLIDDASHFPGLATALAGADHADPPEGRCLGSQGITLLLKRLQHALIADGYLTSRVTVPNQDLNDGTLEISVRAGRLEGLRFADDSPARTHLAGAMPARQGEILNLRDIEQGLENLKRLASADADIEIHPAAIEGASDLVVRYSRERPWRVTLAADDGGLKATGKLQGSVTLAYDNPTGLNDLAYLTLSHDLMADGADRGTWGALGHYSIPWGYWSADLTVSRNRDRQTVQGATTDYIYGGYSNTAELNLSRILHRDGKGKTALRLGAWRRSSHNFIDDTEVEVQRRQTGGWQLGASHRRFIGAGTFDAALEYKRGTGAFGAIPAPEEAFGEATGRFRKTTLDVAYARPFAVADTRLAYVAQVRAQWHHSRLNPQEMFVIGGRYTVRGFDGERVLAAERGWLLRNELALPLGAFPASAYLAIDAGRVDGPTAERLAGQTLAGAVLGLRGSWHDLQFDLFAGGPLHKPDGFDTSARTAGFRVNLTL